MTVDHLMHLRGPELFGPTDGLGPILLERTDAKFMANVREALGDPSSWDSVRASRVRPREDGGLRLYQPVHRVFHLAVVGAFCEAPGRPRVDPLKIDSAGLVIRRLVRDESGALREQAWLIDDDGTTRWGAPDRQEPVGHGTLSKSANVATAPLEYADPEPDRRPRRSSGRPELDALIAQLRAEGSVRREQTAPLFPLPPTLAEAAGETLLFGLVPTASLDVERASTLPAPTLDQLDSSDFFPEQFTTTNALNIPKANETLSDPRAVLDDEDLARYVDFVREVVVTFDLDSASAGATRLRALLSAVKLSYADDRTVDALSHLRAAARVFVHAEDDASVEMPEEWPSLPTQTQTALREAALDSTRARFADASADTPRFGQRGARYIVRTFMRVRRDDGCPPKLVWSPPSAPFRIASWFESSPAPQQIIELPNPTREGLKAIKPNVAFAVPSMISDLLANNSTDDLLAGKAEQREPGSGIQWICGFSIPIITLCAFILLTIIINLLNIVFWWLPFVKICIPLPKFSSGTSEP